ncbi:wd g-beta repeat-containing protein [Cystoisospora suis]|uniref:Wd g-beta repeat-containing protein n=1 Tax=Cystoisospora suis TaxID=483139 RepID=A0A2C6KIQ4_9APIC|nr:wd g-beta repeat-containing protein [Cystoisospora suis]
MTTISYVEYPIYSIATDGSVVATSGGGGGSDYGIEDQLETHRVNLETGQLLPLISSAEAGGVVDSLSYNKNVDLWCGCCQGQVLLVTHDQERGLKIAKRFGPPAPSGGKRARLITARFSPSGEIVVAGGEDQVVRVWRISRETATSPPSTSAAVSPTERKEEQDSGWTATLVCELRGHEGDIKDCCISCDNSLVASCGADHKLCLWDWRSGTLLHTIEKQNPKKPQEKLTFRCARFLPTPPGVPPGSGQRLLAVACGTRGPSYFVGWCIAHGGQEGAVSPPGVTNKKNDDEDTSNKGTALGAAGSGLVSDAGPVTVSQLCESMCDDSVPCCQAEVSSDGQLIAVGFADGKCKVYNRGLSLVAESSKHDLPVTGLCFLNENKTLVSTSADYSVVTMNLTRESSGCCSWCCCRKRTCCCCFLLLIIALITLLAVHYVASIGYMHFINKHEAAQMGLYRQTTANLLIQQRLRDFEQSQLGVDRRHAVNQEEPRFGEQPPAPRQAASPAKKEKRRQRVQGQVKDEL